ncbi:MAG TPA: thiamine pyrophosphate-binding protein [bacterium]|nr:thiamine pyrophosphate-binding protein [bacterium]
MANVTGAQLAAQALLDRGIDRIFTLSGGHITPIYQYLENTSIKLIDTRHEQAAVFMAEAYGRMTRKPGVVMVTAGPGFTNALSAVANAYMANAPLLIISGCVAMCKCEKLDLQDIRQAPVIEPMVKKAFVCHSPERVAEFIDLAYRLTTAGRPGPVYLELPVDVLNTAVNEFSAKKPQTAVASHPVDLEKADELVAMLREAKKPMIIAGSGAWYADAGDELTALAEKIGVPVFTVTMGRGTIPDTHPYCFESALGLRPGATLFAQSDADLVVFLGTRISLFFLFGQLIDNSAKIVQVDIEPEEIGRNHSVDLGIVSDIRALLKQCNRLIDEGGDAETLKTQYSQWVEILRLTEKTAKASTQANWDSDATPIHPLRLAREVNDFMDRDDDIVIADGGDTQIWMGMTRTIKQAGRYLDSGLFGCLGVGLPYANSAKILHPDSRVCLIIGDGSTGFNFMEFETAVRKNIPIVVVISNDLGWGMIRHSQQLRIGHAIDDGTHIGKVDYHKLVEALGGEGYYVEKPEDIRPALEAAFASGKPACINVMTDPSTISPGSVALASV